MMKLPYLLFTFSYLIKSVLQDQNAGAVSTVVYELAQDSYAKSKQNITIFGSQIDNPKTNIHYQGLQAKHHFWQSRNKAMGRAYLNEPRNADIIEVHGRPQIALQIAKARPESQVILYLHNDPRTMKGAREPSERITLQSICQRLSQSRIMSKTAFLMALTRRRPIARYISSIIWA